MGWSGDGKRARFEINFAVVHGCFSEGGDSILSAFLGRLCCKTTTKLANDQPGYTCACIHSTYSETSKKRTHHSDCLLPIDFSYIYVEPLKRDNFCTMDKRSPIDAVA